MHPLELLRGDLKLQESVEKKTLSDETGLGQKSPFDSWTSLIYSYLAFIMKSCGALLSLQFITVSLQ